MSDALSPPEAELVNSFRAEFGDLRGERVFLYGIGPVTQLLLEQIPSLKVAGLLDAGAVGQTLFGVPVLGLPDALSQKPDRIIIVARESATRIVHRRIGQECAEAGVPIFDLQGRLLGETELDLDASDEYWALTADSVKAQLDKASSVSFDIFDTLITRKVLFPRDVWELVAEAAAPLGVSDYVGLRTRAEAEAGAQRPATLTGIYARFADLGGYSAEIAEQVRQLELDLEKKVLVVREAVVDLFNHALSRGIPVTLISDMYLPDAFLREVLAELGISGYRTLLVSGEQGVTKQNGLFDLVQSQPDGTHIHIGDNPEHDAHPARAAGMTPIVIRSGLDMLMASPARGIISDAQDLPCRLALGLGVATVFNDPFATANTHGRVPIRDARDLTRLMVAPLFVSVAVWLVDQAQQHHLDLVLMVARDGYLIEKLYSATIGSRAALGMETDALPPAAYFLASRVVANLVSIKTADDAAEVAALPFSGGARELMNARFSLDLDPNCAESWPADPRQLAIQHSEEIIAHAAEVRANYLTYIERFGIAPDTAVGIFDFVTRGSAQKGVETLLGRALMGLYCIWIRDQRPGRQELKVLARQTLDHDSGRNRGLNAAYLFIEGLLTSPMPNLKGFGPGGEPQYAAEWRSPEQLETVRVAHDETLAYFEEWVSLSPRHVREPLAQDFTEALLDLLDPRYTALAPGLFEDHRIVDEFINVSSSWRDITDSPH